MIQELGLRYHPNSIDLIEPHKLKIVALIEDLAHIPLGPLGRAIDHWKQHSAFMPKASDLIHLAANFAAGVAADKAKRRDQADPANAKIDAENPEWGYRWIQTETTCELHPVSDLRRGVNIDGETVWAFKPPEPRCTPEQAAAIMKDFGIKSSILATVVGALKSPPSMPTEADYAALEARTPSWRGRIG